MNEKPQILDQFGNPITSSQLEQTEKPIEQMPEPVEQKSEQIQSPEKIQGQIAIEHEKLDKNQQDIKDQVEKMGGIQAVREKMHSIDVTGKGYVSSVDVITESLRGIIAPAKFALEELVENPTKVIGSGALVVIATSLMVMLPAAGLSNAELNNYLSTAVNGLPAAGAITAGVISAGSSLLCGGVALGNKISNFFERRKLKKLEKKATEAGIE